MCHWKVSGHIYIDLIKQFSGSLAFVGKIAKLATVVLVLQIKCAISFSHAVHLQDFFFFFGRGGGGEFVPLPPSYRNLVCSSSVMHACDACM